MFGVLANGFALLAACAAAPGTSENAKSGAIPKLQSVQAVDATHPIIGRWKWTREDQGCSEVYDYKADGSLIIQSGDERTENIYTIAKTPDDRGFYKVTIKVITDFRGRDCMNNDDDDTGNEASSYIVMNRGKTIYAMCQQPSTERCFGPMLKQSDGSTPR
jgi:hypothetical protein